MIASNMAGMREQVFECSALRKCKAKGRPLIAKATPLRNAGGRLLFAEMTRRFHRPAHRGGPMEAGRCFSPGFSAAFAPPELSRRLINRPGFVCARMHLHHLAAEDDSPQN